MFISHASTQCRHHINVSAIHQHDQRLLRRRHFVVRRVGLPPARISLAWLTFSTDIRYQLAGQSLPIKHETLTQCCFNVEPTLVRCLVLARYYTDNSSYACKHPHLTKVSILRKIWLYLMLSWHGDIVTILNGMESIFHSKPTNGNYLFSTSQWYNILFVYYFERAELIIIIITRL